MDLATLIGTAATVASTASFSPQAWKIIKTRRTHDISTGMYALTVSGFALWTAYGVALGQWPLIITNSICFLLSSFILTMKLLPKRQKQEVADAVLEVVHELAPDDQTPIQDHKRRRSLE
jgi:MtN3 and saliva related transmembrane protein